VTRASPRSVDAPAGGRMRLASGGFYAELYRVQMEGTAAHNGRPVLNLSSEIRTKFGSSKI